MKISGGSISLRGNISMPGDKSISHRAAMIGSLAEGETIVDNFLMAEDCLSTVSCLKEMGVNFSFADKRLAIEGVGLKGLKKPKRELYVGNSGTTIRLLSGILVGQDFISIISGDQSIMKRPMDRIIEPLGLMGAKISGVEGGYPPLDIEPSATLEGISYKQRVASAQVKSSILLASLYAEGTTHIIQPSLSRDHTERMLKYFGIDVLAKEKDIFIKKVKKITGRRISVPGDISSAAFFIVGGLILKNSKLTIRDIGLNETRTGIIDVLKAMGGKIELSNYRVVNNEPIGDILVEYSKLKGLEIKGDIIPRIIDEIPIIAVAASLAEGTTIIRNAEELKLKETNRIKAVVNELRKMGVDITELEDGMIINGGNKLTSAELHTYKDHRIAMALTMASLSADGESEIMETESVNISFPSFFDLLEEIMF